MYATGFWKVATKNAASRQDEARRERAAALAAAERNRIALPATTPAPASAQGSNTPPMS